MEGTSFQFLNRIIDSYAGALCSCEVWIQRWVHVLLLCLSKQKKIKNRRKTVKNPKTWKWNFLLKRGKNYGSSSQMFNCAQTDGTKAKKSTSFFRPFCFIITMKGLWIKRVLFPSYWGLSPSCLEVPILLDPAGRLPRDSNMVLSSVGVGSFKNKLSYTFLLNLFLYPSLSLFSFSLTASSSFFTIFFFLLFFDALFLRIIVTLRLPLS